MHTVLPEMASRGLSTVPSVGPCVLPPEVPHEVPTSTPLWHNGWYRCARILESPNFGPRPKLSHIDLVVVHCISLPPGAYGNGHVQRLFTNQLDWDAHPYFQSIQGLQVSAHFFISRTGELWQFVSCDARAWHAGQSVFGGRHNCNDYSIGIELEGTEGHCFEVAQYDTLYAISTALTSQYPVACFAGHEHIAPDRKKDPGAGFDWLKLQRCVALPDKVFP